MILLLGSNGYIGTQFQKYLTLRSVSWKAGDWKSFVFDRRSNLIRDLKKSKVSFVLNCAGYTGKPNVDACELSKADCLNGNAVLPAAIREICESIGIVWGHVSSGCIYSGERPGGGGWKESDAPNFTFSRPPSSFYSGTKALGERALGWREEKNISGGLSWKHESSPSGYVWRLRIPFGEIDCARNYLSKLLNYKTLLEARNSLSQLDDFVRACLDCIENRVPYGIYNVTNPGSVKTSQVVDMIKKSGVSRKDFRFFESEEAFMKSVAQTPRSNCILDVEKLSSAGIVLRPIEEAIEWSLGNWSDKRSCKGLI